MKNILACILVLSLLSVAKAQENDGYVKPTDTSVFLQTFPAPLLGEAACEDVRNPRRPTHRRREAQ